MPIQIDRKRAETLASQFDEARELVRNEFHGLDTHRQYRNAFARLLKPDPLGRVLMMGTDQRDMFAPELRRVIETSVPSDGHIFDFGAGDGQTFALVADSVPQGTRVSIEEPNPEYLANYRAFLKTKAHLRPGAALAAEFDEIDAAAERSGEKLPLDGSIDLGLALHMIYFVSDLPTSIIRMVRFLKPGGALFVVVTDETVGYTGLALKSFIEQGGDTGDNARHLAVIEERRRLLGVPAEGGGAIAEVLGAAGTPVEINVQRQASRLYGHNLADLVALSSIALLAGIEGLDKYEAATALLRHNPEAADLRIEDDGPRKGMWSVTQPQWVAVLRRSLVTSAAFDHDELDGCHQEDFPLSRRQKFVVGVMSEPIMPSVLLAGCCSAHRVLAGDTGAHGDPHTAREQSRSHCANAPGPPCSFQASRSVRELR